MSRENQIEEIHRLLKRIEALEQSRDVWKSRAQTLGKQLFEVLSKSKNCWIEGEEE